MTLREMREERMRLYEQAKEVFAVAKKDDRLLNSADHEKVNKIYAQMDALKAQIDAEDRLAEEKRLLEKVDKPKVGAGTGAGSI